MSDKKKKKSKQKQKQKQQQTQQVIVNVGRRVRRREEPRREVVRENKLNISAQPPPIVQYVYRDNLALNSINERMRENAITQTLMKTAQQLASQTQPQPQKDPKLATPSPALYQQPSLSTKSSSVTETVLQPTTTQSNTSPGLSRSNNVYSSTVPLHSPTPSSTSNVQTVIQKNQLFNQPNIPNENSNKNISLFDRITKPQTRSDSNKNTQRRDDEVDDDSIPISDFTMLPWKLTKQGLPRKNAKNYNEIMETYIGNLPVGVRNEQQQKAYEEYMMNNLKKPSSNADDDNEPPTIPLVRTYGVQSPLGRNLQTSLGRINSSTIQSIKSNLDFQEEDDED